MPAASCFSKPFQIQACFLQANPSFSSPVLGNIKGLQGATCEFRSSPNFSLSGRPRTAVAAIGIEGSLESKVARFWVFRNSFYASIFATTN
jgi:hypothetical protein